MGTTDVWHYELVRLVRDAYPLLHARYADPSTTTRGEWDAANRWFAAAVPYVAAGAAKNVEAALQPTGVVVGEPDLQQIAYDLASIDPVGASGLCKFCDAYPTAGKTVWHDQSCVWRRAREWKEQQSTERAAG